MDIRILPPEEMIEAEVKLPLSKSMSNRALIMNALTHQSFPIINVAMCEDTSVMLQALTRPPMGDVNVGAAGTAMRFLTAYYAAKPGASVVLDGSERMRKRPIGPLVEVLRQCGADIEYVGEDGYPPLRINGKQLHGGNFEIDATVSSQFISALLMVAPTFDSQLLLNLKGEIASLPYLLMTIEMMRRRGIDAELYRDEITVNPGKYHLVPNDIEHDWSAATYWYSIVALSGGWVTLRDMGLESLQGDRRAVEIFAKIGALTNEEDGNLELSATPDVYSRLDEDLSDCPDMVQTLVVACCMIGVPFTFSGVSSLRIKETDRLEALVNETAKIGCALEIVGDDVIKWTGKKLPVFRIPEIETYNDHRMAMAFAPCSLYIPGIVIKDCEVVNKSYPTFWHDLANAKFLIADAATNARIN